MHLERLPIRHPGPASMLLPGWQRGGPAAASWTPRFDTSLRSADPAAGLLCVRTRLLIPPRLVMVSSWTARRVLKRIGHRPPFERHG
ncbi:MAG: hypothetical protein QOC56_429, partial [Alphaproteobacteria bacterium]|nr:hypothetical protein [Alphaproteobacteria bacterium]